MDKYDRITMVMIMHYKREEFDFIDLHLIRLKDENGKYWYPMSHFLSNILFREVKTSKCRDDPRFAPFMKVIEYVPLNTQNPNPVKTWFINDEGLRNFLSKVRIPNEAPQDMAVKKRYLIEAYAMFNVQEGGVEQTEYITYTPPLTQYDVWSRICLTHDTTLTGRVVWKKCSKCGFFYPDTKRYYTDIGRRLRSPSCKQCGGGDFVCQNNRLQYIHKRNGQEFLYQWFKGNKDKAYQEMDKWLREGDIFK